MNIRYVAAAILGLACVSAAESPRNYSVYGGPDVESDPVLLDVYDKAVMTCSHEASIPPRGTPYTASYYYNAALRACLSRHGFTDKGAFAYPSNSLF